MTDIHRHELFGKPSLAPSSNALAVLTFVARPVLFAEGAVTACGRAIFGGYFGAHCAELRQRVRGFA